MLKRTSRAAFAGGMYVFPGGRVDGDDHLHKFDALSQGPLDEQAAQQQALGAEWRGYWIACVRECFEEAGLLLAYDASGGLVPYDTDEQRDRWQALRSPIHSGALGLDDLCSNEAVILALDRIHFLNRFVTPLGRSRRFDTRFFIAESPPQQAGVHDQLETVASEWISPTRAIAESEAGNFDLMFVTKIQLQLIAEFKTVSEVIQMARDNRNFPVFRPKLPRSN
jgi:8-oxo-dGTP pyrophosphatase MutT (NUDIX family)